MIFKNLLKNIRFWIILIFLLRLYGITNPPVETSHNWRQSTVNMVARNFYEISPDILLPRVDFAGEKTGITGMEFPLFNYLIYLMSLLFGYAHWYGRLINLTVSSIGILFFYKTIKKYFSKDMAFYADIILMFSIWFAFSRKIMPDTFSFSLIIIAFYYGSNYLENKKPIQLLYYALLTLAGILSKIPSAYILILYIPFFFDKTKSFNRKILLSLTTLIILVPVISWYFYYVPYLVKKYEFWHFFMGKNIVDGSKEILEHIPDALKRFYENALKFIGFALFLTGIFFSLKNQDKKILRTLLLAFTGFSVIIVKSGFTFTHHDYYIIPFVPIMAMIAAYALDNIKWIKLRYILLFAIAIECIGNYQHDFRLNKNLDLLSLETDLNKVMDHNDLILINSGPYPTPMYFAHHKGWVESNDKLNDKQFIQNLKAKGLKYIVVLKRCFNKDIKLNYNVLFNNEKYCIYRI